MIVTRTITRQAATGALTGLALGDALGFPTEFDNVPWILAKCGPWRQMRLPKPAVVSDDTQMTLALGRGIRAAMDRGALTPMRLVRPVRDEFVDWYHSPDNNRAPGRTCMTASATRTRTAAPTSPAGSGTSGATPGTPRPSSTPSAAGRSASPHWSASRTRCGTRPRRPIPAR